MAVRLVKGGLQTYDPKQATKSDISRILRTGKRVSGGSSKMSISKEASDAAIARQQAQQRENILRAEREAEAEKARLEKIRQDLIRQKNTQRKIIQSRLARTGERLEIETLKNNSNTMRIVKNLDTGAVTYNVYGTGRGGGGVRLKEGVDFAEQSKKEIQQIRLELGEEGLVPIQNRRGEVIGFTSRDTGKTYKYNTQGIEAYEKDKENIGAQLKRQARILKETGTTEIPTFDKSKISGRLKSYIDNNEKQLRFSRERLEKKKSSSTYRRLEELNKKKILTPEEVREASKLAEEIGKDNKEYLKSLGRVAINSLANLGYGTVDLYNTIKNNPKVILTLPGSFIQGIRSDISTVKGSKTNPQATVDLVIEYIALGAAFKAIGAGLKGTARILNKFRPGYVKRVNRKWVLRKAPKETFKVRGQTRYLKKRVPKPSIKRPFSSVSNFLSGRKPGQFKKFTKDPGIILKESFVDTTGMPLSQQVGLAGRQVTAVNAAADQITSWLRRRKIIRKPIPGEADFPQKIKSLLKKFDEGKKLTNREFADVNLWLQKKVAPNITLLERSLYADPASGLRISRLGIKPERRASLIDVLRGNFKLRGARPQVLVFENAKVAKFPSYLKDVERKLKMGLKLNSNETNRLIRWQVKTGSGQFKPIGSTIYAGGKELEVTLAPGEMIRRIKQVGFTYIDGKKVTFVTAEIFKPSKLILNQIKLANLGKLTKPQLKKLELSLSKKLGRKIKVETPDLIRTSSRELRRLNPNTPVLRIRGNDIFVNSLRRFIQSKRFTPRLKRVSMRATSRTRVRAPRGVTPRVKTRSPSRARTRSPRSTTPRKPVRTRTPRKRVIPRPMTPRTRPRPRIPRSSPPPKRIPPKIFRPKGFTTKNLSRKTPVYYVVEKRRGKLIKLAPKPFILKDAKDFLAYTIDNNLSRTAFLIPLGTTKQIVTPPQKIKGYFSQVSNKLRPYKIRRGQRKELLRGYIEKRKYIMDTPQEKKQAKLLRKKNPTNRKELLKRLKKARAVRMRNLKRRKK